jgi:pyridoxal phosphate enzyme (YggS family)
VTIATRVAVVRGQIAEAARRAGRDPLEVRLVAATKTQPVDAIAAVMAAGVCDLGENRAQELVAKAPELVHLDPTWHFIGRLQRNKIKQLAPWVSCWQSIDRVELADSLAARVDAATALVEVNVAGEPQKGGCTTEEVVPLVDHLRTLGIAVTGLMTVAPTGVDPRPTFSKLRGLAAICEVTELSMGMSADFEAAIAEGATIVRVGTGLFGMRATFPQFPPPER